MPEGATTSPGPASASSVAQLRRSRFLGQQYADITKLREMAARQDRLASRHEQRISRLNTKIERLRHQATLLREKGQKVLGGVPEIEQEIKQLQRDADAATSRRSASPLTSDITALHYRIRKLQQKVVDLQQRARALELHAAQKTQRTAELKVKVDRYLEAAHLAAQEATQFRQRADRLQLVAEQDAATAPASAASPVTSPPPTDAPSPPPS
jgi:predicted  nucleic acid-binding Zn-ribbon protein